MKSKRQIFLSHSGQDAERATALAAELERELALYGMEVEVFNTSEPEHRFQESYGTDQSELRAYLQEHLSASKAFLALVTPQSLAAGSEVIEFEMEVARDAARHNDAGAFSFHASPTAPDYRGSLR